MRFKIIELLILMFFDVLFIISAFVFSYLIRLGTFNHSLFPFLEYIEMALLIVPIWWGLLFLSGRYSLKEQSLFIHLKHIIFASLSSSLLFPLLFYFTNDQFFSRGIVFLIFILGVLFLFSESIFIYFLNKWKTKNNIGLSNMLVIGSGRNAKKIIKKLLLSCTAHKPVAILSPYGSKEKYIHSIPIVGKLNELESTFIKYNIKEVFLCEAIEHSENLISFCRNKGIILRTSLDTLGITSKSLEAENIGGVIFLTIQQSPLFGWGQFFKRLFDFLISIIVLTLTFPYFLINKKYLTYELFMKNNNETFKGLVFKKNNKIFAKKLSLIWNVLKKDISLVGPSLLSKVEHDETFSLEKNSVSSKFIIRSGIFHHNIKDKNFREILEEDILYIRNWNFFSDLKIIFYNLFK
jgi:hypothetical protein